MSPRLTPILTRVFLKMRSTELPVSTRTLVIVQSPIPTSTRSESLCGIWTPSESSAEKVIWGLAYKVEGQLLAVTAFWQNSSMDLIESL